MRTKPALFLRLAVAVICAGSVLDDRRSGAVAHGGRATMISTGPADPEPEPRSR